LGKAITVTSSAGAKTTIIDGGKIGPVATFSSGEGARSVLRHFTLQNGTSTFNSQYAGGVYIMAHRQPFPTTLFKTTPLAVMVAGSASHSDRRELKAIPSRTTSNRVALVDREGEESHWSARALHRSSLTRFRTMSGEVTVEGSLYSRPAPLPS
jgi:hypothetical protein